MVEIIRMHVAALEHPTYGVNAQLGSIPQDEGDPDIPEIQRILDTTKNDEAILQKRVMDYPVIVVSLQSPIDMEREFGDVLRDSLAAQVFIDIVTSLSPEPAPSARDTLYYIRAILRCLKELMAPGHEDDTMRNGIQLIAMNKVVWGPTNVELANGRIVGTVVPDYLIRDHLP